MELPKDAVAVGTDKQEDPSTTRRPSSLDAFDPSTETQATTLPRPQTSQGDSVREDHIYIRMDHFNTARLTSFKSVDDVPCTVHSSEVVYQTMRPQWSPPPCEMTRPNPVYDVPPPPRPYPARTQYGVTPVHPTTRYTGERCHLSVAGDSTTSMPTVPQPMPVFHDYEEISGRPTYGRTSSTPASGGGRYVESGVARLLAQPQPQRTTASMGELTGRIKEMTLRLSGPRIPADGVDPPARRQDVDGGCRLCSGQGTYGCILRRSTHDGGDRRPSPATPRRPSSGDLSEEQTLLKDMAQNIESMMASIDGQNRRMDTLIESSLYSNVVKKDKKKKVTRDDENEYAAPREFYRSLDILADGHDDSAVRTENVEGYVYYPPPTAGERHLSPPAKRGFAIVDTGTPVSKKRRLGILSCIGLRR